MSGNRDQLLSFFLAQRDALTRFLARRVGNPDIAEDLAQETWLRLATGTVPQEVSNPRAFIFRVAANVATDTLRRRGRVSALLASEDAGGAVPDPTPSAETRLIDRDRLRALEQALDALSENARAALLLNRIGGETHAEIARRLGVSESMVAKYIAQGMRCCRDWLHDETQK
jgi:RNA polymerase sigma factor (sigma-70 family)